MNPAPRDQAQAILDKLQVIFDEQGLKVTLVELRGDQIILDIERLSPGMPVAFMVQAIGGTFRRYMPQIQQAVLGKYQGLPEPVPEPNQAAPAEPLFRFRALPEVDLDKISDKLAARQALVAFVDMVRHQQLNSLRVVGVTTAASYQALLGLCAKQEVWMHPIADQPGNYMVHLDIVPKSVDIGQHPADCGVAEPGETIPAKILLSARQAPPASESNG